MSLVKMDGKAEKTKAKPKPYKCPECPKRFRDRRDMVSHSHLHSDETPFQCLLCEYAGKTKKYLNRHIKYIHKRVRNFECGVCGKAFAFASALKSHSWVHTGEKPYKCEECEKAFNTSYSLNTHKLIHTNSKPFKCTFCPYACRDSSTLRKHKERHTGQVKYYTCSLCNVSCAKKATLKVHIAEKHFNVEAKLMECDACGQRYKRRASLVHHIQTVHDKSKRAECDVCGKTLVNRGSMRAHMRTHVDQKPFLCTFSGCRKRYKDQSTLSKHVITHYPETQFPCKICDRLFSRKIRMEAHLKTHIAKVKKVECGYCGVRFYNKNYLTTHIQRKHGRKKQKYVCDECGLVTTNKPGIVMHIKYGHGHGAKEIKCNICNKTFKKDFNLKLHYWTAHGTEYIPVRRKKRCNKTSAVEVEVKQEPIDNEYEGVPYFQVTPKMEPLDEEGIEVLTSIVPEPDGQNQLENITNDVLEEFITPVEKGYEDRRLKPAKGFVDKKLEKRVKKKVESFMKERIKKKEERDKEIRKKNEERGRKMAKRSLELTRRKYNRLIRNAIKNSLKKDKIKIKHGAISAQEQQQQSLLEANFFIKQTIDDADRVIDEAFIDYEEERNKSEESGIDNNLPIEEEKETETRTEDEETNEIGRYIDQSKEVEDMEEQSKEEVDENGMSTEEENSKYGNREVGRNRKLTFNTHQCYVCFKLYQTKEELLEHCKEHFNQSNMQTLKKCPICKYTTNLSLSTHLKRKHNIKIKMPYGSFKHDKQSNGTKYYYEVNDARIKTVEIIPSIKNLNKRASCKIDKRNREKKNKDVLKSKLVKKGKEWIVMKEKIKINFNDCLLPKFDKVESTNVKGKYVDRLKELYKLAKRNGKKMVFPCDSCDKICQTVAALKLHSRKHESNPKPFKTKVWKHKLKGKTVDKKKVPTVNNDNRTAKPKPVVNKHKCDKELIKFYEENIRGGDIEFWQFLKIYNKMERENINDFEDLQKSSHFGIHFNEPVENTLNSESANLNKPNETLNSKLTNNDRNKLVKKQVINTTNGFKRVVRLSKRELMRRDVAKKRLREKLQCNNRNS